MAKQQNKIIDLKKNIEIVFTKQNTIITSETEKTIDEILINNEGQKLIVDNLIDRIKLKEETPTIIDGLIYQKIIKIDNKNIKEKIIKELPRGVVNFEGFNKVNYYSLQELLIDQKFQEADTLTHQYLCELVKSKSTEIKKWLYFTDIQFLPKQELFIVDLLWKIYSKGKFGFSIQKKIWIKNNKNWDKLWEKIYWLKQGVMKRYPEEFIWTIDAPEGHLPLSNQLRGTKTLLYLFHNIEW